MREKEKKRMWSQSSPDASGSFTLGAGGGGEGWSEGPTAPTRTRPICPGC